MNNSTSRRTATDSASCSLFVPPRTCRSHGGPSRSTSLHLEPSSLNMRQQEIRCVYGILVSTVWGRSHFHLSGCFHASARPTPHRARMSEDASRQAVARTLQDSGRMLCTVSTSRTRERTYVGMYTQTERHAMRFRGIDSTGDDSLRARSRKARLTRQEGEAQSTNQDRSRLIFGSVAGMSLKQA